MDEAKTTSPAPAEAAGAHETGNEHGHGHGGNIVATYLTVWVALLVLTLVEYFYAFAFKDLFLLLIAGLLLWAGIKAVLVAWYFMHLKYDLHWAYMAIVPAIIFATAFVLGLVPDIAMKPTDESLEDTGWSTPARAGDLAPPFAIAARAAERNA